MRRGSTLLSKPSGDNVAEGSMVPYSMSMLEETRKWTENSTMRCPGGGYLKSEGGLKAA